MKPRHKRIALIGGGLTVLMAAVGLILNAMNSSLVFFFTPTQVAADEAPRNRAFRLGGLVKEGSVRRESDGLTIQFAVTDTAKSIPVYFKGILPDLFKEGKGAVVQGRLGGDGRFVATEVLAKHDENYMPPQAKYAVDEAGKK